MHRGKARVIATKNVYQMLINRETMDEVVAQYETRDDFLMELCYGVSEHLENLTNEIKQNLKKGWSIERLNTIDLAITLVAAFELLYTDLDRRIIINEAVDNAKVFCDDDRYKFINGVLDKIGK